MTESISKQCTWRNILFSRSRIVSISHSEVRVNWVPRLPMSKEELATLKTISQSVQKSFLSKHTLNSLCLRPRKKRPKENLPSSKLSMVLHLNLQRRHNLFNFKVFMISCTIKTDRVRHLTWIRKLFLMDRHWNFWKVREVLSAFSLLLRLRHRPPSKTWNGINLSKSPIPFPSSSLFLRLPIFSIWLAVSCNMTRLRPKLHNFR